MVSNEEIIAALFVIAPQFKTDDPLELARYNALIDMLRCTICEKDFGKCYLMAFAYYLAHILTIDKLAPTIGMTSSISEGQLSISYNTNTGKTGLESTLYGRQFLALRGTGQTKMFVARGGFCYGFPYFYPNMGSGYPNHGGCC